MSMTKLSHAELASTLDSFLTSFKKKAQADDANSTHPSAKVDDQTAPATEGARSSENSADVKDTVGASVDAAGKATNDKTSNPPYKDLNAKPTGEDSKNETGSVKSTKDDPGTSMPATVGNEKYSNLLNRSNDILSTIAAMTDKAAGKKEKAESKEAPKAEPAANNTTTDTKSNEEASAAMAGYKAASVLMEHLGLDKTATDSQAAALTTVITNIQKEAQADALKTADFCLGYLTQVKKAQDMAAMQGAPAEAAGQGMPPEAAAGQGGGQEQMQQVAMIVQALLEAGVTPEMLMQFAEQVAGSAQGGAPAAPQEAAAEGNMEETPAADEAAEKAAMERVVRKIMSIGAASNNKNNKR